ncbi:hypothetical protein GpartN1_g3425.t1 [Galdieria partita]|uniref:CDAN1-interacting nuclease 1 n=1 Tax=Galdieria partita TaxID=83374 RepID=A0A9C7UQ64_9RHOD|nr:hypothetical protein GpartN1_g3425.t1 [Galdieria partita]
MRLEEYETLCSKLHCRKDVYLLSGVSSSLRDTESISYNYETLYAIYSQRYQTEVTAVARDAMKELCFLSTLYDSGQHLLDISERLNIAPCITVRRLLEYKNFGKKQISRFLRNPHEISDDRLRQEVIACIEQDEHYGPFADRMRQVQGLDYEHILYQNLEILDIPFETETALRCKGLFKTPDVLLHLPVKVGTNVINWIDSKAKFGDEYYLRRDYNDSISSYVGRYGSGMVIYWFGFLEDIDVPMLHDQGVVLSSSFPKNIRLV